jgi:hypothetical protein
MLDPVLVYSDRLAGWLNLIPVKDTGRPEARPVPESPELGPVIEPINVSQLVSLVFGELRPPSVFPQSFG